MKTWKLLVAAGALVMASQVAHAAETITAGGSTTIQPILMEAAKKFMQTHPGVKFVVGGGGSSHGVKSAGGGQMQLGMASREIHAKEKAAYADLVTHKIAQDGVAVIVHKTNPLAKITKQQVQDIYSGKIANWKELGGKDAAIALIAKAEGHSTLELFLEYFGLEAKQSEEGGKKYLVHRKKGGDAFAPAKALTRDHNRENIASVALNPNAIGYVSVGTAQEVAEKGGAIKLLELDGVAPTVENVKNSTYPFRRPLYLVTKGEAKGMVKQFIDYISRGDGRKIVTSLDFVPVN